MRGALVLTAVLVIGGGDGPAAAQEDGLTGSAFGFFTSVGLFGGPPTEIGPAPQVTLPPEGSAEPVTMTDPDGTSVQFGPAVIVEPTAMTVSTQGQADGVTSTAALEFSEDRDAQLDPLNAARVVSECTATPAGLSGSATLSDATLVLRTDEESGEPAEEVDVPADPEPNTTLGGTIDHVGDTFRVVFNEQIEAGGILTVNAVHVYFGQDAEGAATGGVAQGEAILGQAVCGLSASTGADPATAPTSTSVSTGEATTTTVAASASEPADGGGGGGTALLIGALALAGVLVAVRAVRSRQADVPSQEADVPPEG
ncbi:MAG TPA: hypothetical protein VNT56_04955 [Acidimicrobiales bacterium]|nr:hypothetical protein [Acidimicrobiales bacterium]